MNKAEKVVKYYVLCNKLKDIIRTGWIDWKVKRKRLESVAEHIFGTQALAIAMYSEYNYQINLEKVLYMLAVHELEEIVIGDLTEFQIEKASKNEIGHKAICKILEGMINEKEIMSLILEFDEQMTEEAKFAYHCDKLECNLQCKLYDEESCVSLNNQKGNPTYENKRVQELLASGNSWSSMWAEYHRPKYKDDKNFMDVLDYIKNKNISVNIKKKSENN